MKAQILEKKSNFQFLGNQKIFVFFVFVQNLRIGEKRHKKTNSIANLPPLLIKRVQVSLIPYVYEKSFYSTSILRQMCYNPAENFEKGKILFVKNRYSYNYFLTFSEIVSDFGRTVFSRVVKTAIYMSKGTF